MSINIYERKDMRGGGYAKRKFTYEEAQKVSGWSKTGKYTQHDLASMYKVSQSIINKILRFKTYVKI
jgi:hypothetical protein